MATPTKGKQMKNAIIMVVTVTGCVVAGLMIYDYIKTKKALKKSEGE